ncbi:helix-turn-helix domain-containing protein [Paenibacillus peoriae]|uniref:winged helix-turn-helix transcriptional regulator n=1 Tax=Paenibacillus peoriae TaxID=59893 RepID=UPI00026C6205|nr:helix-turn-helix domain-containing protein [Paenibacillus peoriae]MEC0181109.1 helix-turn-helix domain-containing protein [Paenibacillus peoriae]
MSDDRQPKLLCGKVEQSFQIISKKWTALIIHALMEHPKRFSEIHVSIPDLSKRMLNERIKELELSGLILRNVITERPVRTEYSLTRKGKELGDALNGVESWAERWL